ELMAEAVEQNIPYALKFGVSLELDNPGEQVWGCLDPDRILQVVSNLLSNAIKFSPADGVVTLRLRADESSITVSVIDRGRGMSPEFLGRLFDRFSQEGHVGNGQASSGLGLAISKSIVEHHGGTIEVSSVVEAGTEFRVILPKPKPA
ncbi:MAG: ATP-binding protein, partial [Alphaproteobacteria bacterium]